MKKTGLYAGVLALVLTGAGARAAMVAVDPALPEYKSAGGVSGSIKSVGSDTMNNLMTLWAEGFKKVYPNVTVEIEGKGSATAPPALIAGAATFGPMSREMKSSEVDAFEHAFGYKPACIKTAVDMIGVYVNKDNPVRKLTFAQLDAIFSKTRKRGYDYSVEKWGEVGVKEGDWGAAAISVYGRNSASGTYAFFKEHVLDKGDYNDAVKEMPGSSAVVQAVASDKYGIGYSGIGYKTADVRAVPLSKKATGAGVEAIAENGYSGKYPLSRFLLIYLNAKPGKGLDPLSREFVKFIFSKQGQEVVAKDGYLPVMADTARESLKAVGITPEF